MNATSTPVPPISAPSFFPVPNPTHAFWTHSEPNANPLAKEGSTGDLPEDVDVAVIGSGITGISVAYHLALLFKLKNKERKEKVPLKVAIFEARDFCSGATGRNGGHLTAKGPLEFKADVKTFGLADAVRQVQIEDYTTSELTRIIHDHDLAEKIDFQQPGRIAIIKTEEEFEFFRESIDGAKEAGLDVSEHRILEVEEMQKRYGISEPGLQQPGASLWPLKLITELYNIAKNLTPNLSLSVHTHTPVHSISPSSKSTGRWVLSTPRGTVNASKVVHATNGYAAHLVQHLATKIVPTRSQHIALRTTNPIPRPAFLINWAGDYWFPRPAAPGEAQMVIAGGCRRYAGPPYASGTVDDGVVDAKIGKALRELLPGVFPGAFEGEVEPEMEWTGIMGFSSTGSPFVGPLLDENGKPVSGQYICAGYQGHGMPRAYACAEVVARMLAGDIDGTGKWELPEWLPRCYLTVPHKETKDEA